MSSAKTQIERAQDPPGECTELKKGIEERYHDIYAGAIAFVNRRCGWMKVSARQELAESIVQEAVTRAWKNRAKYDPTRQPVAWIMGFVFKVAQEHTAKPSKQITHTDLGDERLDRLMAGLMVPVADGRDVGELEMLNLARQKLGPEQQRVLVLAFDEGLDGAALAERLAVTPGAARVAKCRALQALRTTYQLLDDSEGQQS